MGQSVSKIANDKNYVISDSIESCGIVIDFSHPNNLSEMLKNSIKFKNLIISDDLSMKSLKHTLSQNTAKAFEAGCNIVLHCNGNLKEMTIVAKKSPKVSSFIIKKTSEFYKNLS